MKNSSVGNWTFQRLLRFVLGFAVIVQGISESAWMVGLIGAAFAAMAFFNVGCCGTGGCAVPVNSKKRNPSKDGKLRGN